MKTLTTPLTTQKDAEQSGWVELFDVYLKSAITTPWGTLSTLRMAANYGTDFAFFTPTIAPEPTGTQGDAATYKPWPITREQIRGSQRFQNDKLSVAASNVTGEFAQMLAAVDWYDVWFVIRKVSSTIAIPTADDCAVVFIGQVDSARINNQQLQFMVSNDLGNLQAIAPRENMHQNCRFNWTDDQCTAIRFRQENYKTKVCGNGSLKTRVKTGDLVEDGASPGYLQRDVTADAGTDKISFIGHGLANGDRVKFSCATGGSIPGGLTAGEWYYIVNAGADDFKVALTDGGAAIDITSAGSGVMIDSTAPYGTDQVDVLADAAITASSEKGAYGSAAVTWFQARFGYAYAGSYWCRLDGPLTHALIQNSVVQFSATILPTPLVAATNYYVQRVNDFYFYVASSADGPEVPVTSSGTGVVLSTSADFLAYRVRNSTAGYWAMDTADWGTLSNGFRQIPDAQAGLANAALKPWLQFDFGSAKTPRLWRLHMPAEQPRESLFRLVAFFSSSDAATWTHEHYFELPPIAGQWFEVLIPKASTKRYWRICIRSKWVELATEVAFDTICAYEHGRHWWRDGVIRFDAATATAALRGVTRKVLASYNGAVDVVALPAVPTSGDTFAIERGCPRTFNACTERRNWENFGGFLDLPNQTIIR